MATQIGRRAMTLVAGVAAALTTAAFGQTKSEQPGFLPANFGGVPSAAPRPISLGGVQAQGGVPAQAPGPMTIGRPPSVAPMQVHPMPIGPINTTPSIPPPRFTPTTVGPGTHFNHSPSVIGTDGVFINGSFHDDHFRLQFHIGSGLGFHDRPFDRHHHHHGTVFTSAPFFFSPWWYDYSSGREYNTIYGFYQPADPNVASTTTTSSPSTPAAEPKTVQMTGRDLGVLYLSAGDPKSAVSELRKWVRDHADDAEALRMLGVALLENAQVSDGASSMALAYHSDPSLAAKPIPPELFMTEKRLRDDVRKASIYANRVRSSASWLAVAVLMQSEGRGDAARSMIEKAKAAGLEAPVADRLLQELGDK